ncbi:uncharacterized protein LOC106172578 [Lingula anatina]|uniref:Uncharacterized protein LOC106172578 n=1 Tax=Lingula anatina TaxID=7574 RepID=A0A1S3JF83_LINAN|nr:uncharacterized protein LOC106172578 [Lingula anatina]|eukprot:XP_013408811.1 uncharacterized protein LOC106172578 [Lingula anatina]
MKTSMEAYLSEFSTMKQEVKNLTDITADIPYFYYYRDILAQASCAALNARGGWVYAVRRVCSDKAPPCSSVCANRALSNQDNQVKANGLECFNALHVYSAQRLSPNPSMDTDTLGLKTHRYNSCGGRHCGPNYCCCRSK